MSSGSFFDFQAKLRRPRAAAAADSSNPANTPVETLSVTQLTASIDRLLKSGLPAQLHVKGELSNYSIHRASGHHYFTLKDASACMDCVFWADEAGRIKFTPTDGLEVIATGRIAVYAQRGRHQLYVKALVPVGQGALELAFRQLREKLEREGLFAPERKKAIPPYPMHIVLVTSQQTAALADILKVLCRFAWLKLSLYHVPVQGETAGRQIAAALCEVDQARHTLGGVDVIILGRGGGSLEDLWCFNDEAVARAIAQCHIPVVTGIGHEVDTSIADLVADYHAHTPTEAAQVVVQYWKNARPWIDQAGHRAQRGIRGLLESARQRLAHIERHEAFRRPLFRISMLRQLLDDRERMLALEMRERLRSISRRIEQMSQRVEQQHPRHQIKLAMHRLADLESRLRRGITDDVAGRSTRLAAMTAHLDAVGPLQVLRRGYSITMRKKDRLIINSIAQLHPGDRMVTRLADGEVEWIAEDTRQLRLF